MAVISSLNDGISLQTALFTLTGSCTLVLALGCVELVGELEADTLIVIVSGGFRIDTVTIHIEICIPRMKNVISRNGNGQSIIT